jgi:hypothetical protein
MLADGPGECTGSMPCFLAVRSRSGMAGLMFRHIYSRYCQVPLSGEALKHDRDENIGSENAFTRSNWNQKVGSRVLMEPNQPLGEMGGVFVEWGARLLRLWNSSH